MLLYVLALLIPVVGVAYIFWTYRKHSADKEAATRKRVALILQDVRREDASAADTAPAAAAVTRAAAGTPSAPAAKPPVAAWIARERFLSQPETLLYYVLKAGLPDHEIFAHVSLAALVGGAQDMTGYERDQQLRRLAQHEVNFVVCDKSMRVVAAVELNHVAAGPAQDLKAECLRAAGIRLVRVNPAALPRREEVRNLVCGAQS